MKLYNTLFASLFSLGLCGSAVADLNDGLIAYYPFNASADDKSGNENNGTEKGGVSYASGKLGQAANFDGIDDYIEINPINNNLNMTDFSVSVWVKNTGWKQQPSSYSGADRQYIFDGHSLSSSGNIFFSPGFGIIFDRTTDTKEAIHNFTTDTTNTSETNIETKLSDEWVHITYIRKEGNFFTYVDKQLMPNNFVHDELQDELVNMNHTWFIGTYSGNNRNYSHVARGFNYSFKGIIDELYIYNRALTELEIKELYSINTDTGVCTGTGTNTNECIATYNADGTLNIPCVSVPNAFGGTTIYEADMAIIPLSSPLSFELIDARIK